MQVGLRDDHPQKTVVNLECSDISGTTYTTRLELRLDEPHPALLSQRCLDGQPPVAAATPV
jgi:hypothetical protein